jgi:hypothetical protein
MFVIATVKCQQNCPWWIINRVGQGEQQNFWQILTWAGHGEQKNNEMSLGNPSREKEREIMTLIVAIPRASFKF